MSYQQPNYYPPAVLPTSTLALVSLISGILGFTLLPLIGSIVAVITGMMARGETRGSPPTASGDGLATAGIIMGWIGIALNVCGLCLFISFLILPFLLVLLGASAESGAMLWQFFI